MLAARPYRLLGDVTADFLAIERRLAAGDVRGALRAYRAPLLVESDADRIVRARDELEGALRRRAMDGGPDTLWAWLATDSGRRRPARVRPRRRPDDPRRAVAAARARALHVRWDSAA